MSAQPEFPSVISSSMRETFSKCPRKFYWEQIRGYLPSGDSEHLVFGAAYADGMEAFRIAYYETYADESDHELRLGNSLADGALVALRAYGEYEPPEGSAKHAENLIAAMIQYTIDFDPRYDNVKPSFFEGRPRLEFSFSFRVPEVEHPTTGDPILFTGRLDMLAEVDGALFVFDDKTTKSLGPYWMQQWRLRSQFTAYCLGAQIHDLPVVGAIVRGMGILKTKISSAQVVVTRPPHLIEAWKTRLVYDVRRMIDMWNDGYWPETGQENGGCSDYGGCPYAVVCEAKHPEPFLDSNFTNMRWDPVIRELR